MKKTTIQGYVVLAVVLAAFCAIAFAVPFVKNATFWLAFAFTIVAFGVEIYAFRTSFGKEDVRSKFYGFPIARLAVLYFIVQLILALVLMALAQWVPAWAAVILLVLLLAATLVGLIASEVMRDEIERQDVVLKKDVSTMRALQSKANAIVAQAEDEPLKKALETFAENLRYSDPVSSEAIAEIEAELTHCVDELQQAVIDGAVDAATTLCRKAEFTLVERNRLCKLNK